MPSEAFFRRSWAAAWWGLGAHADAALRDELLRCYAEPHRRYHTRQHLHECLAWLPRLAAEADHPAEVALALWFHDAIYRPERHDNEALCAEWARSAIWAACGASSANWAAGSASAVAERVHALVLATRHAAEPQGADQQVLVDIDLAILGAPPSRFAQYEQQVRQEYATVPEAAFRAGRHRILEGFLARPRLFATATGRALFEARARVNLQGSVAALAANPRGLTQST
jgi:predicted metal-dependent HD superfamily phosphohydrolase